MSKEEKEVALSEQAEYFYVTFDVVIEGFGQNDEQSKDLFIDFKKLDSVHSCANFSLSISKAIVEQMGGNVTNRGTQCRINFKTFAKIPHLNSQSLVDFHRDPSPIRNINLIHSI